MSDDTIETAGEQSAEPVENPEAREAAATEAKYRVRAKEAEASLEATSAALRAARSELLRFHLADYKIDGRRFDTAALEDAIGDPDSLFDESGRIDPAKLDETMQAVHEAKPYMFAGASGPIIPGQGKTPERPARLNTWESAFAPTRD